MDGKLVTASPSDSEEPIAETYSERFHLEFPKYLAMGMSTYEYWDGDPELAEDYRKAKEIQNEEKNMELWLQGMYIYEAISDIAPILHAFAKKGTKARPYPSRPYPLTDKDRKKAKKKEEHAEYNKGKQYMTALAVSFNKRFDKREDVSVNERSND